MGRLKYNKIASGKIMPQRNIVISEAIDRDNNEFLGYSVTEQLETSDSQGRVTKAFLKYGLGIIDKEGLSELRKAINEACEKLGISEEYYEKPHMTPDEYLQDKMK